MPATLVSHDTLADMVLEVDRALRGLAALGTTIPDIDDLGYQFGCLAGILSDKLGEVYCALNDWVAHDRKQATEHAPTEQEPAADEGVTVADLKQALRELPPDLQHSLIALLKQFRPTMFRKEGKPNLGET